MRNTTRNLMLATIGISCASLWGCASNEALPTRADFDAANKMCYARVKSDTRNRHPRWFTRWLECKQQHVMPMEIMIYPTKDHEIRTMYAKLIEMGKAVDQGRSKVEPVYGEWDRMLAEIGIPRGTCIHYPDGSQYCTNLKALYK